MGDATKNFLAIFIGDLIGGTMRALIAGVGGWLAAVGYISAEDAMTVVEKLTSGVAGFTVIAVAIVLSYINKIFTPNEIQEITTAAKRGHVTVVEVNPKVDG